MRLIVAEKPSVGRTIAEVLGASDEKKGYIEGSDCIVTWCRGHLAELANPETYDARYAKYNSDDLPIIPSAWKLTVGNGAADQYQIVKNLMLDSRVTEIVSATDAGREGECIFRYVYMLTGCQKPVLRLWTSSLEESAIRQGFAELKPQAAYDNLFAAGFARAKADWLIGMNGSRLFSLKYFVKGGLTVGRVQTPTLAMIVQREQDIKNFVKKPYYIVELDCGFQASSERFEEKPAAEAVQEQCSGQTATVTAVNREKKTENPPKLYDLTTLQRDANRMFGYTAAETLSYAQSLYEAKLLTYPRTDSNYITTDMEQTVTALVHSVLTGMTVASGMDPAEPDIKRLIRDDKVSDHHALLPTAKAASTDLSALPVGERNLISLVAARLIAAVSKPHIYEAVTVEINCAGNHFTAKGKTVLQGGWKSADQQMRDRLKNNNTDTPEPDETENVLPDLSEGQTFENVPAVLVEKFTHPPKPFTEDTLLAAMERAGNDSYEEDAGDIEKKGIGTPATRAAIIEGLVRREYIIRKKKQILPTEKGTLLIGIVPESLKSAKTTAEWETVLQHIERGSSVMNADEFIRNIEEQTRSLIRQYGGTSAEKENNPFYQQKEREEIGICPKCGKPVVELPKSYACSSGKNGCGFMIWKTMSGKSVSAAQAKKILEKKKSDLIKGFQSKQGKSFDAYIVLKDDNTVGFEFPPRKK